MFQRGLDPPRSERHPAQPNAGRIEHRIADGRRHQGDRRFAGTGGFDAIAVVADTDSLTAPCGACRQLIWEFCGDVPVILANLKGKTETILMHDLFPKPFDASSL